MTNRRAYTARRVVTTTKGIAKLHSSVGLLQLINLLGGGTFCNHFGTGSVLVVHPRPEAKGERVSMALGYFNNLERYLNRLGERIRIIHCVGNDKRQ